VRKSLLLVVLLFVTPSLWAQHQHKPESAKSEEERPASDSRSFMELFGKLERDWGLAVQRKDQVSIDALVAPEFVERQAMDPDRIVTRAEWMEQNLKDYRLDPSGIRSMTVRAFLGNAVVIFVQTQKAPATGFSGGGDYFIVDVWVTNHGSWQVASRSVSPRVTREDPVR